MKSARQPVAGEPIVDPASETTFLLPGGVPVSWVVLGIPAVAIVLVALLVLGKAPAGKSIAPSTRVATAALVFADRSDGSVEVRRQSDQAVVARLAPATNAFVRVMLAGLVRERRREGQGDPARPFTVTRWSDGRLTLDDTATGRLIELASFGPDNRRAFESLLDAALRKPGDASTGELPPAARGHQTLDNAASGRIDGDAAPTASPPVVGRTEAGRATAASR